MPKMIYKYILILLYFLNINVNSLPSGYNDDPDTKEEEDKIDLTELGDNIFGVPKNSSGDILKNWDPNTAKNNPEENGEYFEGDILFPKGMNRNGMKSQSLRWPNKRIPYVIEGSFTSTEKGLIDAAIVDFHKWTCVRFVPRTTETDYLAIISTNTGCWSSVGKIGGRQVLNLQTPGCVTLKGTPAHELNHAIGFLHEQSRTERDLFVAIYPQNIIPGYASNFNKASKFTTTAFGVPYDYDSVMHYSEYAFSSNGQKTIKPRLLGAKIGQRRGISFKDKIKINKMYKCSKIFIWLSLLSSIIG